EDGSDPRVMDVIDVPLLDPRPKTYQQENWLLDPQQYWKKVGRASLRALSQVVDEVTALWINGDRTYHGRNDRIPLARANDLTSSLCLIQVDRLKLAVFPPGERFGNPKRRVQAWFQHCDEQY